MKSFWLALLVAAVITPLVAFGQQEDTLQEKTPEAPAVYAEVTKLLEESKYAEAVARIDQELAAGDDDFRLNATKSYIQYKFLDDSPAAMATIDAAIERKSTFYKLYEFKVHLIEGGKFENKPELIVKVYEDIAEAFKNRPDSLSEMGASMLRGNQEKVRLREALILLKAAKEGAANSAKGVKYTVSVNLARGYYFASRADLAAKEQIEAMEYANDYELIAGKAQLEFYQEAARIAETL